MIQRKLKPGEKIEESEKEEEYGSVIQKNLSPPIAINPFDSAFVENVLVDATTPDLAVRLNKAFERPFGELEESKKRIEVRKELQDTVKSMTADERAISLERYPGVKKQMSIEEYSMFISTGDIPAQLIKHFSISGSDHSRKRTTRGVKKVSKKNITKLDRIIRNLRNDNWLE